MAVWRNHTMLCCVFILDSNGKCCQCQQRFYNGFHSWWPHNHEYQPKWKCRSCRMCETHSWPWWVIQQNSNNTVLHHIHIFFVNSTFYLFIYLFMSVLAKSKLQYQIGETSMLFFLTEFLFTQGESWIRQHNYKTHNTRTNIHNKGTNKPSCSTADWWHQHKTKTRYWHHGWL